MYIRNVLGTYYATLKNPHGPGGYVGSGTNFAEAIEACLAHAQDYIEETKVKVVCTCH